MSTILATTLLIMVTFGVLLVGARARHRARLYRAAEQIVARGHGLAELDRISSLRKALLADRGTDDSSTFATGIDGQTRLRHGEDLLFYERAIRDELEARGLARR